MANFKTHITISTIASAIISTSLLLIGIYTFLDAFLVFILGVVGGIFPDIDSENSKSARVLFNILPVSITAIYLFTIAPNYFFVEMLTLSVVTFVVIRFGFIRIFQWITVHRGMFHSIPMAFVVGLIVVLISHYLFTSNQLSSWIYGSAVTINYIIHLITDEIYSIDIYNQRVKKSLGSALKLFRVKTTTDKIYSFLTYLVLLVLLYLAPSSHLIIYVIIDNS